MKEQFVVRVNNTRTQSVTTITSTAETLGELKNELSNAGVDYSGMTFMEGSTKIELKDDSSILPTNVPVKRNGVATGETTNNLAIFLTAPSKHIASGAASTRKEAYEFLKAHPAVADAFKAKYGKHYTNASTDALLEFINQPSQKTTAKAKSAKVESIGVDSKMKADVVNYLNELYDAGYVSTEIRNGIVDILNGKEAPKVIKGYSDDDMEEMYGDGEWLK